MSNGNTPQLTPAELAPVVVRAIQEKLPLIISGPPGAGKTALIKTAADDAGADLMITHAVTASPVDAKGMPSISADRQSAEFLPFGDIKRAMEQPADVPLVWFLDDFGQATEAVQASFMQLILGRRINGHAISEAVTFMVATNRREDKAGVRSILEPVKSRFVSIVEMVPDMGWWIRWAAANLPATEHTEQILAFLQWRPESFFDHSPTSDLVNSPAPRTWKHCSDVLEAFGPICEPATLKSLVAGAIGPEHGGYFFAFKNLAATLPNPDDVIDNPDLLDIAGSEMPSLYATITAVGMRANAGNFDGIAKLADRLTAADRGEFAALLVDQALQRDEGIAHVPSYHTMMAGKVGDVINGGVK